MNEPHVYDVRNHRSWGDHIEVLDWDKGRITGHLPRKPRVGDRIRFPMQSGMLGETVVRSVEHPLDPPDMFFATVEHLGYVGDPPPSAAPAGPQGRNR